MSKEKKHYSFYDTYSDELYEYLDEVRTYLQYNDKDYIKLQRNMNDLIDTSENIQNIICNDKITNPLSIEESIKLAKIISIYVDIQIIVERELYFKGGAGAYDYFKKIGIIV